VDILGGESVPNIKAGLVFQRDVARLSAVRRCGWTVSRFTSDDGLRHPIVGARVRMALAAVDLRA
jgi:hypothetical protein